MAGPSLHSLDSLLVAELTTVFSSAQTAPTPQGESQPWQLVSPPLTSALVTASKAVSRDVTTAAAATRVPGSGAGTYSGGILIVS